MKISLEHQAILTNAGLAVTALAISILIIWPTAQKIRQADQETFELRSYLEQRYQRSLNLRSTLQDIAEIKANVQQQAEFLFHAGDELKLVTILEGLAERNNVTQSVSQTSVDTSKTGPILLSLTLKGAYPNVLQYLADLESLPQFITITRLRLTPQIEHRTTVEKTAEPLITANLDLSIYAAD